MVGSWTLRVEARTHTIKAEIPFAFSWRRHKLTVYVDGQPIYQTGTVVAVNEVGRFYFYGHDCVVRVSGWLGHLGGTLELFIGGRNADGITELPNLLRNQPPPRPT